MNSGLVQDLICLARKALEGRATFDEVNHFMGNVHKDDSSHIKSLAHEIIHFISDEDTRDDDDEYDKISRMRILVLVNELEEDQ